MKHIVKKNYIENGKNREIEVVIRLDDECKNGHCSWSITGTVYGLYKRNGETRLIDETAGCIHEEILKRFPEFRDFVALHLSDAHGAPLYPVANSHYILTRDGVEAAANYMHIPTSLASKLSGDKDLFKYQLFALGIVDRWETQSAAAIAHLEELTGQVWVNPYTKDNERNDLTMSDEERLVMEERVKNGYYSAEAIAERAKKAADEKRQKERAELVERYEKTIKNAQMERAVMLSVFDKAGSVDNVIFYNHSHELVFNWMCPTNYHKCWTLREFLDFCRAAIKLPVVVNNGINIFIKDAETGRKMHFTEVEELPFEQRNK